MIAIAGLIGHVAMAQSPPDIVRDAGPGPSGRYLAMVLAKPTTRVLTADTVAIPRDSAFRGDVVILAKRVTMSGRADGDVIVVGGDLFIKPAARITGRAIAIGGGVYASALASVQGGKTSEPDFTFDATPVNGAVELQYRELTVASSGPSVLLPGIFGLRLPTYDRSNGLSLPVGLHIGAFNSRSSIEPFATYRSQIGQLDPSVDANLYIGRKFFVHGFAGRETRTNDSWITSDFSNSLNALFIGRDTRNWYRDNRDLLTVNRVFETPAMTSTYRLGGQFERASSARPGDPLPTSGPWSFFGKHSNEGMLRPNPQIAGGDITSLIGGANYLFNATDVTSALDLGVEVPTSTASGRHFVQLTLDGQVNFPTFVSQRFRFDAHAVVTRGDTAPGQRFAYLGGAGTLGTVEPLLSLGGDELLFIESRYIIPVSQISLPLVGSPTVTLRHILGTAAIQHLPALTQIVGVRLSVLLLRADVLMDTKTRKVEVHTGLSLVR